MKLENDKYYTPLNIAESVYNITKDILKIDNPLFIEPSAGAGVFLDVLEKNNEKYLAYDLFPEDNRIFKSDFLTTNIKYSDNNIVIGNPPFGGRGGFVIRSFINKSKECANYVSFILPISYLNKYDPLYSNDLGKINFSGVELNVCHNIYDLSAINFKAIKIDIKNLKTFQVIRGRGFCGLYNKFRNSNDFSKFKIFRFNSYGSSAGKLMVDDNLTYVKEIHVAINMGDDYFIIESLEKALVKIKHISTPCISLSTFNLTLLGILDEINIQKN